MEKLLYYYQHLPEHINPVAFKVGFFSVDWYSLGYLVGFVVVYCLLRYRMAKGEFFGKIQDTRYKIQDIIADFMFYAILGVLIGGRLGYVLFYNLPYYISHPLEAFLPIQATDYGLQVTGIYGMSFHGGLIGVILAGIIFVWRCQGSTFGKSKAAIRSNLWKSFWQWADFVIPAIPAGYFFGRIGNFLNGELYGRATDAWWGMYFPLSAETQNFSSLQLRHPSQLYEAFFEGLVLFIILWFFRNRLQVTGYGLCAYLAGYGLFRFLIEFFRDPDPQIGLIFNTFTLGQLFSLIMIAGGICIFFVIRRKNSYNRANDNE